MKERISDLRVELLNVFNNLKTGELSPQVASEMSNAAGKIIATAKTQLLYSQLRKEKPSIKYLDEK